MDSTRTTETMSHLRQSPSPKKSPRKQHQKSNEAKMTEIQALIKECTEKLQLDPFCLKTRAIRGHTFMKAKMWEQAAAEFTHIIKVRNDDVHGIFSRGMALFKNGQTQEAINDFTAVLGFEPHHAMARYARAGCYQRGGDFKKAFDDYEFALKCDTTKGKAREGHRLYLHWKAGKYINSKFSLREKLHHEMTSSNTPSTSTSKKVFAQTQEDSSKNSAFESTSLSLNDETNAEKIEKTLVNSTLKPAKKISPLKEEVRQTAALLKKTFHREGIISTENQSRHGIVVLENDLNRGKSIKSKQISPKAWDKKDASKKISVKASGVSSPARVVQVHLSLVGKDSSQHILTSPQISKPSTLVSDTTCMGKNKDNATGAPEGVYKISNRPRNVPVVSIAL